MEYKTVLEPHEWYTWKREHPAEYQIIKAYILHHFLFVTVPYKGVPHTNLLIPRRYFTYGLMQCFLLQYRHLQKFEHMDFIEKGGNYVSIQVDYDAVLLYAMCDYMAGGEEALIGA